MSTKNSLSSGTNLGHYKILSQLGAGGMGEVYLAEDTKLHRKVAIKLLPAGSLESENANRRLLREAQSAAKLDHPNICGILEVSQANGRNFICMQYVEGETLEARMKRHQLELLESLAIAVHQEYSNVENGTTPLQDVMDSNLAPLIKSGRAGFEVVLKGYTANVPAPALD